MPPTKSDPTPTKKTRTPAARAATAYNRIEELRHARDVEIANAPDSINARYEAKFSKVREGLGEDLEALELLDRMMGKSS